MSCLEDLLSLQHLADVQSPNNNVLFPSLVVQILPLLEIDAPTPSALSIPQAEKKSPSDA
jgi:hypothetical protein